jgi:hypothetical protein
MMVSCLFALPDMKGVFQPLVCSLYDKTFGLVFIQKIRWIAYAAY